MSGWFKIVVLFVILVLTPKMLFRSHIHDIDSCFLEPTLAAILDLILFGTLHFLYSHFQSIIVLKIKLTVSLALCRCINAVLMLLITYQNNCISKVFFPPYAKGG